MAIGIQMCGRPIFRWIKVTKLRLILSVAAFYVINILFTCCQFFFSCFIERGSLAWKVVCLFEESDVIDVHQLHPTRKVGLKSWVFIWGRWRHWRASVPNFEDLSKRRPCSLVANKRHILPKSVETGLSLLRALMLMSFVSCDGEGMSSALPVS